MCAGVPMWVACLALASAALSFPVRAPERTQPRNASIVANMNEKGSHLTSKVPPAKVARAVELARHHLSRLRHSSAPPAAVMLELILNAWVAQTITSAADLGVADALADGPRPASSWQTGSAPTRTL